MITEIPKGKWKAFFNDLTLSLKGWETKVELLSPGVGSQMVSAGLPFSGLTLGENHSRTVIELTLGTDAESHIAHTLAQPEKVVFEGESAAEGVVLKIEGTGGRKTLVTFAHAF